MLQVVTVDTVNKTLFDTANKKIFVNKRFFDEQTGHLKDNSHFLISLFKLIGVYFEANFHLGILKIFRYLDP